MRNETVRNVMAATRCLRAFFSQKQWTCFRSTSTCDHTVFAEAVPRTTTSCTQICKKETILRGRWSDLRSARIYINDSLSMQAASSLGSLGARRVLEFKNIFADCPPSPPRDGVTRLGNVERPTCLKSLLCPSCVDPPG